MSINRTAIVQQLQWQLQQHFGDGADIHLLKQAVDVGDAPQLVITPAHEIENSEEQPTSATQPNATRQLIINLQCQINQTNELLMLQSFDTLASGVHQVLNPQTLSQVVNGQVEQGQTNLWQQATVVRTDFDFTPLASPDKAHMRLTINIFYQVIEIEDCPDLTINEVYLSTQGGPHELVTTLPDNQ